MSVVSIILPTYNRSRFLVGAISSIRAQQWSDWELVIVDDGSTDETAEIIDELTAGIKQPVKFIQQENQGAYGARNTGLDHARGKYIAFYDSDDEWLPHHLMDCVNALEDNLEVDCAYGACRVIDESTGEILSDHTFYVDGTPRPFLNLKSRRTGKLHVIDDSHATECMITAGLYNGLQNSVIRSSVFEDYRFDWQERNEAEDQLFVIQMLLEGRKLGYFDNVHVNYKVHDDNSSAAGGANDLDRQSRVIRLTIDGYERLYCREEIQASPQLKKALRKRLATECFWKLGFSTLLQQGMRDEAQNRFRQGLSYWPWDWRCWKTYALSTIRNRIQSQKTTSEGLQS